MKEKELNNKLIEYFSSIKDTTIISSTDFTDERESNMIVISIDSVNQVYPSTPDYEYNITILVDTFIEDDEKGELHKNTVKILQEKINYMMNKNNYVEIFEDIPVVGVLFNGNNQSISDSSNRTEVSILLYSSF